MLNKFKEFMDDPTAPEMYITGVAGTGKTTELKTLVDYCMQKGITSVTCAYTHKAVKVLASKLSPPTEKNALSTLHSFLKKRPTINDQAVEVAHVDGNQQVALPPQVDVLFVDEFSMVGKKDYLDILEAQYADPVQDPDDMVVKPKKLLVTKVVYIGDPNQLPPVKDEAVVEPHGEYHVHLTKVYRQAGDNPLLDTLTDLNNYINGEAAKPLGSHETLIRGCDLVDLYKKDRKGSKIVLAYTNQQVEYLNAAIQGYDKPRLGDLLFTPTIRKFYELVEISDNIESVVAINGDQVFLDSKYKTLETLHEMDFVKFYMVNNEDGNPSNRAVVFGHHEYMMRSRDLATEAVAVNKEIERRFGFDSKEWAQNNWSHELAKKRARAWKRYLSFKNTVLCMDFPHAMTVHKSQGSTYENVYLDIEDIGKCANNNYGLYLKLLYVGISRASKKVFTN